MLREDSINFGLNFVIYQALIALLDSETQIRINNARTDRFSKFQAIENKIEAEIEEMEPTLNQAVEEYLRRIENQMWDSFQVRLDEST